MKFFVARHKIQKQVLRAAAATAAAALCFALPGVEAKAAGAIGLALCAPALLWYLTKYRRANPNEPALIIDERGVFDQVQGWELPWSAVRSARALAIYSMPILSLDVERPERFVREVPKAWKRSRMLGWPEVTISFAELEPGLEVALNQIREVGSQVEIHTAA